MDGKIPVAVLASWWEAPNEWGSGFVTLKQREISGELEATIVGVISQHPHGWVSTKAADLWVRFIHMEKPFSVENYQNIIYEILAAEYVFASGWIKFIKGIPANRCINIHPGPLGKYGGKDMYGDAVHKAIYADLKKRDIKRTCVTMHFVTPKYDDPAWMIFQMPVELSSDPDIMRYIDDEEACVAAIKKKVNKVEHERQRQISNMVVKGEISAHRDPITETLSNIKFPQGYQRNKTVDLAA